MGEPTWKKNAFNALQAKEEADLAAHMERERKELDRQRRLKELLHNKLSEILRDEIPPIDEWTFHNTSHAITGEFGGYQWKASSSSYNPWSNTNYRVIFTYAIRYSTRDQWLGFGTLVQLAEVIQKLDESREQNKQLQLNAQGAS